ncbi:MAG: hypothetical protein ACREF7_03655 [Candidatus Saccharimonadales bacterium]
MIDSKEGGDHFGLQFPLGEINRSVKGSGEKLKLIRIDGTLASGKTTLASF